MKYKFNYFFERSEPEQNVEIEAENDTQAVMRFFDEYGIAEFGCIRADGKHFTDDKFPESKHQIMVGC
jgi:hypothetical protein